MTLHRTPNQVQHGATTRPRRSDQWLDYEAFYSHDEDAPPPTPCAHKWVVNLGQTREYCIRCQVGRVEFEAAR